LASLISPLARALFSGFNTLVETAGTPAPQTRTADGDA
jgi:hypothetical protein